MASCQLFPTMHPADEQPQQSRAEWSCWQQSRESNCCQVSPSCQLGLQPAEEEGGEKIANSKFLIVAYVTSKEKLRVAFQKEYCIRARSKRGRYREIHPQCQRDFPRKWMKCIFICVFVFVYLCICICICICICVFVFVYFCICFCIFVFDAVSDVVESGVH